ESIKNYVPDCNLYADLPVFNTVAFNKYETAILYKMRTVTAEEIALAPDVSEGIENRIKAAAESAVTLEELYSLAKTKRYTHARIRRIVLSTFLGLTAEMAAKQAPYIRVLGFNQRGAELLREIKKSATLPLVTKAADVADLSPEAKEMFALECKATDIYNLLSETPLPAGEEKKFVVLRSDN
ncbi:MAG: nucleotidyltransferase family protein, partial [Clostridia bacterium]|nr:nucleotidyltransferase family protein [Clostridia bacterium]